MSLLSTYSTEYRPERGGVREAQRGAGWWPLPDVQHKTMRYTGLNDVVKRITSMIQEGRSHPEVRKYALWATQDIPSSDRSAGHPDMRDFDAVAHAIYSFVLRHVRYTRDPDNVEQLQTPLATIATGAGDCDDLVIVAGSMLASVGLPVRLVLIGEKSNYSHIYLEYQNDKANWIPFDLTLATKPGDAPHGAAIRQVNDLADGLGSVIIGAIVSGVGKLASSIIDKRSNDANNKSAIEQQQNQIEIERLRLEQIKAQQQQQSNTQMVGFGPSLKVGGVEIPFFVTAAAVIGAAVLAAKW